MERHTIKCPLAIGNSVSLFFSADWQLGSALCDEDKIKENIDEAKKRKSLVFLVGDIFDGVFPRDKRYRVSATAKWVSDSDAQANRVVERASKLLAPVASNVQLIALGNHEESVITYSSFDLRDSLRTTLGLGPEVLGGYAGTIRLRTGDFQGVNRNPRTNDYIIRYDHGSAGDTLSKGLVPALRQKSAHRFDLYVTGHLHNRWCVDDVFVDDNELRPCKLLMVGSYLRTINDQTSPMSTYDERWGLAPKPNTGGVFVTLTRQKDRTIKTVVEI